MIRILLHQPTNYKDLLSFFLEGNNDFRILGLLDERNVERTIHTEQPHVILIDVFYQNGLDLLLKIKKMDASLAVIVLTPDPDLPTVMRCLKAGANGYLLKSKTSLPLLIDYITDTVNGGIPISSYLIKDVIGELMTTKLEDVNYEPLTRREEEILKLLVNGMTYKGVSFTLNIALDTVRSHIKSIYTKLNVNSKSEAVVKALKANVC